MQRGGGEGVVPWNPAESNFSKPEIAHVDFEYLIVEPDVNLCNPDEELKAEVLVSSCPVPGDLLWFPALPLWDVLCSSDTSKADSSADFVQFLQAALFGDHRHFPLWVVVGLQPIRGSFHLNQDQLYHCFWKAHSVTPITPSRAGSEPMW